MPAACRKLASGLVVSTCLRHSPPVKAPEFCKLAERLMTQAAAPYFEHAVSIEVQKICDEHGLDFEPDQFGNILVYLQTDSSLRPLAFAAHMDHPGFRLIRRIAPGRWLAQFRGGVPDSYLAPDTKVRLMPGSIPARIAGNPGADRKIELRTPSSRASKGNTDEPTFAVWDLPAFQSKSGRIYGRACDDLIGVASALATIIDLKRTKAAVNVLGLISRAEEVGFHGALALAASQEIQRETIVLSLETSKELPPLKMGKGVIIRVGDRTSIFDSRVTRYLVEVAGQSLKQGIAFQRGLMSGGTCEATAFQEFGYTSSGVCVALGNYHNCGPRNKIRAEYVSIADALSMVTLLTHAAREIRQFDELTGRLKKRLQSYLAEAKTHLIQIPGQNLLP